MGPFRGNRLSVVQGPQGGQRERFSSELLGLMRLPALDAGGLGTRGDTTPEGFRTLEGGTA